MSKRSLRAKLERDAGWSDVLFTIPAVFLPPRFRRIATGRDMILCLNEDMEILVKWSGTQPEPHQPLTPKGFGRLIREVRRNISKYRRDLDVFSRFVSAKAEEPFWDPRRDSLHADREEQPAELSQESQEEVVAVLIGDELVRGKVSELIQMGEQEDFLSSFSWEDVA